MHKGDLVSAVAKKVGDTKAGVERTINALLEVMSESLAKGENVTLIGFGTFKVSQRAARKGVNPQTGSAIQIQACKVCKFKAGKKLKDKVNK